MTSTLFEVYNKGSVHYGKINVFFYVNPGAAGSQQESFAANNFLV